MLGGPGFESRQGEYIFSSPKPSVSPLGLTQPAIQWVPGLFPWSKAAGLKADHSPPSNSEVSNDWCFTSVTLYAFPAWTQI